MKGSVAISAQNRATNSFQGLFTGHDSGDQHFARKTRLELYLLLFTQLGTDIAVTTLYPPTVLQTAGFDTEKADWLAALKRTVEILDITISMVCICLPNRVIFSGGR